MSGDTLTIAPLLDIRLIALMSFIGLGFVLLGLLKGARGSAVRLLVWAVLVAALVNPRYVREQRDPRNDIAVIVVDRTSSQNVGERRQQTDDALRTLKERLAVMENLDVREVEVFDGVAGSQNFANSDSGSNLMAALRKAAGEIPAGRFAGGALITDGQVHDVEVEFGEQEFSGPVHVLLSGQRGETDRRLVIDSAPGYGIVGQDVTIEFHVEDKATGGRSSGAADRAKVTLREGDRLIAETEVTVGREQTVSFPLEHAGQSILEIDVEPVEGELSALNNRTLVNINGVRDRLRVLLVSGQPHAGERTWRNLLKADPSVDLVHFTILRPPEKDDFTPLNELALIAFPVRELFEVKLYDFDLVVFDRYILRDILPPSYLQNISDYVEEGGAVLLAVGPEFAGARSLSETALGKVLPARPTGDIVELPFRAGITDIGKRHPVTTGLSSRAPINRADPTKPGWGRWFRQIDASVESGSTLLSGADNRPLLVLDREGEGRVALMLSDHIWLWARGYDGGGPQAELLRRLAHWLMKEPDLEEESLKAAVNGGELEIVRRSLTDETPEIEVTSPSGAVNRYSMETDVDEIGKIVVPVTEVGLYRISDGTRTVQAASGALNPLEFSDLRATGERTRGLVDIHGGGAFWITDGLPDLRRTKSGRNTSGNGWAGFVENRSYVITGVRQIPLLPGIALVSLLLVLLMGAWWREGR